jgi:two-component system alkaline phosphatase synthesis response regulator PhoP
MSQTLLLVEDEAALRDMLVYRLRAEGYQVLTAADGLSAIDIVRRVHPQIVLLDLMLPGLDGLEVCKQCRADPEMREAVIMMLTARTEESDRILGLELGADDYITKPFSWPELRARLRAQIRRLEQAQGRAWQEGETRLGVLETATLRIDRDTRQLWSAGNPVDLPARLFDLLVYFVRHRGIVLTRARLLEHVWGYDYAGDTRTVDVHVRWLRERIETTPSEPQLILTVRGVGYRFVGE